MLALREFARILRDVLGFAVATRRIGLLLAVAAIALAIALSATATTLAPVALYPLI